MTYTIEGISPTAFESLFGMTDDELAARNALRVTADSPTSYPCRVSLADAMPGDELILLNHVSHDVPTPFRTAYAIYVRKGAESARYADATPDYLDRRTLSLRGFDAAGMLRDAALAMPGTSDAGIRAMFAQPHITSIHAHNAAYGCFLAQIERS